MKKIVSKTQLKKSQQRKQLIAGLLLVGLMIFSTIAYSFMSRDNEETSSSAFHYKGLGFVEQNGYYFANNGQFQITLLNDPRLNNASFEMNLNTSLSKIYNLPLYLDSEDYLSSSLIVQNLGPEVNRLAQRVQFACIDENDCEEEYPIKDCSENLFILRYSNDSKIETIDGCTFIFGSESEITKVVDKMILTLFGNY